MGIAYRFLFCAALAVLLATTIEVSSSALAASLRPEVSVGASRPSIAAEIGKPNPAAVQRLGVSAAPIQRFRLAGDKEMEVASTAYSRVQVAPMVALIKSLPHGSELSTLKLYVATDEEIAALCGTGTMACYDPISERMTISGQSEMIAGISRAAVIAHEYGHHIANNRSGGIWPAFDAGTLRWSTYEQVCKLKHEGEVFPGSEGAHYWENPGEAFAQSYSELVAPGAIWNYSPLLRPDETALRKLLEDVVDPVSPRETSWRVGGATSSRLGIDNAIPVAGGSLTRILKAPFDGRLRIRLHAEHGGRYRLSLVDRSTDQLLAQAGPGAHGSTRLRYADCGHRSLVVEAEPVGTMQPFEARVLAP